MTTLQELIEQRDALNAQIAAMQQAQRAEALSEIRSAMREYQISVEDLGLTGKPAREPKVKGIPKYRDPATQQTWSGRGKRPQWIHDALAAGKSLADYAI
jgi:DNA-binding protein H-NS